MPLTSIASILLRRGAALFFRYSIQFDYSYTAFKFTVTLARADPSPAAESAHNKTLQLWSHWPLGCGRLQCVL